MKTAIQLPALKALVACLALLVSAGTELRSQTFQDDTLRANYLASFVDFIRWEVQKDDETVIGVVGAPKVLAQLREVAESKRSKGRNIRILDIGQEDTIDDVDVIFLGGGQKELWETIIRQSKSKSIVTVGEEAGFLDADGLIEFVVRKNRLRFALNMEVASQYNVGLSSKLAQLAVR